MEDLIVDDGVPTRGHRLGIFDEKYRVAGIAVGHHKVFGRMAALEFATEFVEDVEAMDSRRLLGPPKVAASARPGSAAAKQKINTQWKDLGKCGGCGEAIHGGSVVEIPNLGKFHKDCFACAECKTPLTGVPYQAEKGKAYCKPCRLQLFGDACAKCGEKLEAGVMSGGKKYHKACFEEVKKAAAGKASAPGPTMVKGTSPRPAGAAPKPKVKAKAKVALGTAHKSVQGMGMSYADF